MLKIFWSVLGAILVAFSIWFGAKAVVDQNARTREAFEDLQAANAKADARLVALKYFNKTSVATEPQPAIAETPQQTYYWSLKLTKPIELKNSVGRVVVKLEPRQSVQYVARDNYVARIRYNGADYDIPISATDLK